MKPGRIDGNVGNIAPQTPTLQQKEAQKVEQQPKKGGVTAQDAARIASQAGFQRLGAKKKTAGFDIGDSSQAPIPLPNDDADGEVWNQQRLDSAQGNLALAGSQFGEIAKQSGGSVNMGAAIVASSFMPVEEDLEDLEDLAHRKPQQPVPMLDEMSNSISKLFGIAFDEEPSVAHKVLAAGLLVAGEGESVQVAQGKIAEQPLVGGIEKVTKRGNQAVGEAQKMNKGINKELSVHRTFVFKR